ncbi:hypothetical protein [Dulcicalothrix desertica]|uniref:hypothetical protein n=1 Tax=Dulcicalothrix desertica TaxID=32056 RepID=UPI000F8C9680|nr:hypothetical protein [Dulcicalothrix desertica]
MSPFNYFLQRVGNIPKLSYESLGCTEEIIESPSKPISKESSSITPISVVYPQKRHLSAKIRAFIDFMSELMKQLRQQKIVE